MDLFQSVVPSLVAFLFIRYFFSAVPGFSRYFLLWGILSILASSVAVWVSKTYKILFRFASFRSVLNILLCALIKTVLMAAVCLAFRKMLMYRLLPLILLDGVLTVVMLVCHHSMIFIYQARRDYDEDFAVNSLNVVVYGSSPKSVAIVTRYMRSENYNICGFVSRDPVMADKIVMGYPVKYLPPESNNLPFKDVEAVLFAQKEDLQKETDGLIEECVERGICVLTVPAVKSVNFPGMQANEIKHILENKFIPDRMNGIERSAKRLSDLLVSTILIVFFSPLMLVIVLIIIINDGKPAIFRQERIGRFGRPFNILKFRTMNLDAEKSGPVLYGGDDDPRLTKVGKFLRKHHLDELPQLFNVFMGQMSFVGYRPERKYYIDKIVKVDPRYAYLYQIRPGVTSYATLRNGYTDSLEKMLKRLDYDLYYLNHRSAILDIKILWDTFANIVFGKVF